MFFKIVYQFITGYVTIAVEGYYIERFINICANKNMLLWNIKREKSSFLYANIGIQDFKKIKQIVNKTKCRVELKEKKGIPFFVHQYKKRKIFFFSLILLILIIGVTSRFIWNIEIKGNEKIDTQEIINDLKEEGLSTGIRKSKIDTKTIINNIRLKRQDIAWMGIDLEGTNVIVNIVESDPKPEIIDEEQYCSIVSDKEGMITRIVPKNGTALVKVGDIVKKGSVLIGGWMEGKYTGTRYMHADGEVQAKVWYSRKETLNLKASVKEETGREEKTYAIYFHNFKINLGKSIPKFEKYDTISEKKKIKLFSNFYLPIEIETNCYKEVHIDIMEYKEEQATNILTDRIDTQLLEKISDQRNIVNRQVNVNTMEDQVEVEVIYEVLEDIGTKEKIVF